jgi:hypothetical protein
MIEASGLIEHLSLCHADHSHAHGDHGCDCADDMNAACHVVESGDYRITTPFTALAVPLFFALTVLVYIPPLQEPIATTSPAQSDAPPELARIWNFITRSAPAPRAPSLIQA